MHSWEEKIKARNEDRKEEESSKSTLKWYTLGKKVQEWRGV